MCCFFSCLCIIIPFKAIDKTNHYLIKLMLGIMYMKW